MRFKELVFIMIIVFQSSGCENSSAHSEIIIPKISEIIELGEMNYDPEFNTIEGYYISENDLTKENSKILLLKNKYGDFQLKVISRTNKNNPEFTLTKIFYKKNDSLYTSLIKGKKILLCIYDKMLSIKPEKPEDIEVLTYCWSWGTSLAGDYKKIEGTLGGR